MTNKQLNQCLDLSTFTTPSQPLSLQQSQYSPINFHRFNARYLSGGGALTDLKSISWLDIWKNDIQKDSYLGATKLVGLIERFIQSSSQLNAQHLTVETLQNSHSYLLGKSHKNIGGWRTIESWRGENKKASHRIYFVEPSHIAELIDRLLTFIAAVIPSENRQNDLSPFIIAYTQLINIHPFLDGNGRFSRALFECNISPANASALSPMLYRLTEQGRRDYIDLQMNQTVDCSDIIECDFWQNATKWQQKKQVQLDELIYKAQQSISGKLLLHHLTTDEQCILKILWNQPLISPQQLVQQLHLSPQCIKKSLTTLVRLSLLTPIAPAPVGPATRKMPIFLCKITHDLWYQFEKEILR